MFEVHTFGTGILRRSTGKDVFQAAAREARDEARAGRTSGVDARELAHSAVKCAPPEDLYLESSHGPVPALSVLPRSLLEAGWYPVYVCDTDLTATDVDVGDIAELFARQGGVEAQLQLSDGRRARFRALTMDALTISPPNITAQTSYLLLGFRPTANTRVTALAFTREGKAIAASPRAMRGFFKCRREGSRGQGSRVALD